MEGERDNDLPVQREHFRPFLKILFLVCLSISLCYLLIASPNDILRSRSQFQSWYPQFGLAFAAIAENNCSVAYDTYRYGTRQNTTVDKIRGDTITLFVEPMINCVLGNSSEYIKYALSSSQVILGLTPTIIAILGASSEEVFILALIGRRRFLALLLAAASPSIYTIRSFEYRRPSEILKDRLNVDHVDSTLQNPNRRIIIVICEYIVALAALANTAIVSWELGIRTISSTNPSNTLMPMLWFLLAIPAHIAGAVIFRLSVVRVGEDHSESRGAFKFWKLSVWTSWGTAYWNIILREFWLHPEQGKTEKIYIQLFKESRLFICSAWALSVLIVFHIILGTLILSGTTFIGPRDALGVMMRYIASVVACRVILVYELAVIRVGYRNRWNNES